jgi:hypothetical protein
LPPRVHGRERSMARHRLASGTESR